MSTYPIRCKCNSYICRCGWEVRIEFPSVEAARGAGWMVSGDWPHWHTICPEHAAEFRANVRRMARSEPLGDDEIFGVAV